MRRWESSTWTRHSVKKNVPRQKEWRRKAYKKFSFSRSLFFNVVYEFNETKEKIGRQGKNKQKDVDECHPPEWGENWCNVILHLPSTHIRNRTQQKNITTSLRLFEAIIYILRYLPQSPISWSCLRKRSERSKKKSIEGWDKKEWNWSPIKLGFL